MAGEIAEPDVALVAMTATPLEPWISKIAYQVECGLRSCIEAVCSRHAKIDDASRCERHQNRVCMVGGLSGSDVNFSVWSPNIVGKRQAADVLP